MVSSPDAVISAQLDPGERLVGAGGPRTGLRFQRADWAMIPFSLMWGGFAVFWEVAALHTAAVARGHRPATYIFPLFGIPFAGVGLYLMVGRCFTDAYTRARLAYGVTNQRIIIVRPAFGREVKSLPLRTLSDITLTESADGSGTITFGPSAGGAYPRRRGPATPAFVMIERAKTLYDLIHSAQAAAS